MSKRNLDLHAKFRGNSRSEERISSYRTLKKPFIFDIFKLIKIVFLSIFNKYIFVEYKHEYNDNENNPISFSYVKEQDIKPFFKY